MATCIIIKGAAAVTLFETQDDDDDEDAEEETFHGMAFPRLFTFEIVSRKSKTNVGGDRRDVEPSGVVIFYYSNITL